MDVGPFVVIKDVATILFPSKDALAKNHSETEKKYFKVRIGMYPSDRRSLLILPVRVSLSTHPLLLSQTTQATTTMFLKSQSLPPFADSQLFAIAFSSPSHDVRIVAIGNVDLSISESRFREDGF